VLDRVRDRLAQGELDLIAPVAVEPEIGGCPLGKVASLLEVRQIRGNRVLSSLEADKR
jgi:hypothetical protein